MRVAAFFVALVFVLLCSTHAEAHKPSDAYLTLTTTTDGSPIVEARWDIAIRDLVNAVDLDADNDGKVTWGEITAHRREIVDYARARLTIHMVDGSKAGGECTVNAKAENDNTTNVAIAAHSDGAYVALLFKVSCGSGDSTASDFTKLRVGYYLFFDIDAQHRGLVHVESPAVSRTHVFSATAREMTFDLVEGGRAHQFANIVKEGVIHIWKGYDHVLFLLALLLPAVLRRREDPKSGAATWEAVPKLRVALVDVLRIVTAFTIAHSITLSLAALGVVTLPSRLVESAIAASVVLAAINNVVPILRDDRWVAAFLLGLMHGFGFSSTLMDLDLPRGNLVLTLFGFNLGVEIGQVAIVCVFVPLAYRIRSSPIYTRGILRIGSIAIAALALLWLIERAFVVKILPG